MTSALSPGLGRPRRTAALGELEQMMGHRLVDRTSAAGGGLSISSAMRDGQYTVVSVGGHLDQPARRRLAALLAGLLNAGVRDLVVDLSRVEAVDAALLRLMRHVADKVSAMDGRFDLTGLVPPVLWLMEDEPLADVFAHYRSTLDEGQPSVLGWLNLRCPQGLDDVAEPGSPSRHRVFIDTAAHGRGERWGLRR